MRPFACFLPSLKLPVEFCDVISQNTVWTIWKPAYALLLLEDVQGYLQLLSSHYVILGDDGGGVDDKNSNDHYNTDDGDSYHMFIDKP
eukprot:scaffold137287_cov23-Prasinocladus_malaysianus.AAC.1